MAIAKISGRITEFFGLSSDTKPSITSTVLFDVGSKFFETDTGNWFVWDGATWDSLKSPSSGSGGGTSDLLTADIDPKLGSVTETAPATDTASSGLNGRLQRIAQRVTSLIALLPGSLGQKAKAASLAVTLASDQDALPVTGTFWQATQPVSAASLPLPTGAATSANQPALGQAAMASSLPVAIANNQSAVPVSAASLPLPAGAATSAKQPALGTAGAASADVITVQGIASGTPQPVSGTVTTTPPANASTNITQVGGAALAEGQAAMASSIPVVIASNQTAVPVSGTFWQATQPVSGTVTANAGSGTLATSVADGSDATLGAKADAAQTDQTQTASAVSILKGIIGTLKTLVVLAAGTNHVGQVGGTTIEVTDEFARPADTTAYAVGDAIGAAVTDSGTTALRSITVAAANGGTGYLTKFRLMTDQSACVAVVRVHFYTVAQPPTVIPGDNVAMGLAWANRGKRIGTVDFPALATELGTVTAARAQNIADRLAFQCDPADTKVYYRMETQTVFTPVNGQQFFLALSSERN